MWAGEEQAGTTTFGEKSTNRIESANRYVQRDNPSKTKLVNAMVISVEKWNGQVEEARCQSTYDTENMVIFHGLEHIQSYP